MSTFGLNGCSSSILLLLLVVLVNQADALRTSVQNCGDIPSVASCASTQTCVWKDGECQNPSSEAACNEHTIAASCLESPLRCHWFAAASRCVPGFDQSVAADICPTNQTYVPTPPGVIGYNPADLPSAGVVVFSSVTIDDNLGQISGATISVDDGYSRGSDYLGVPNVTAEGVTSEYQADRGVLTITGVASPSFYARLIANATFFTSSASRHPRTITWTLGERATYNAKSKTIFQYKLSPNATWTESRAYCQLNHSLYGVGALAPFVTREEFSTVYVKFSADAWIGGTDVAVPQTWRWVTGKESHENGTGLIFWKGRDAAHGGQNTNNRYNGGAPWDSNNGEPNNLPGDNYLRTTIQGYWTARANNGTSSTYGGLICAYNAMPTSVYGSQVLQYTGCVFTSIAVHCAANPFECLTYTNPVTHKKTPYSSECAPEKADPALCGVGCAYHSNPHNCSAAPGCHLNRDSIPAICEENKCSGLTATACAATNNLCAFVNGRCEYNKMCSRFNTKRACESLRENHCAWDAATGMCVHTSSW